MECNPDLHYGNPGQCGQQDLPGAVIIGLGMQFSGETLFSLMNPDSTSSTMMGISMFGSHGEPVLMRTIYFSMTDGVVAVSWCVGISL